MKNSSSPEKGHIFSRIENVGSTIYLENITKTKTKTTNNGLKPLNCYQVNMALCPRCINCAESSIKRMVCTILLEYYIFEYEQIFALVLPAIFCICRVSRLIIKQPNVLAACGITIKIELNFSYTKLLKGLQTRLLRLPDTQTYRLLQL